MLEGTYPATLGVDYPEKLNRLTTAFRIFTAIPIAIILALLTSCSAEVLFLPTLLMILFRQKYPRWWFDWNVAASNGFCVYGGFPTRDAAMSRFCSQLS